jgi:formate/nitrite transporter FocA (FNT family)
VSGSRSPHATVEAVEEAAVAKSALPNAPLLVMSVLGGIFIAVGALLSSSPAGRSGSRSRTRAS